MNRTTLLQDRRMEKFEDLLRRWTSGELSGAEAGEVPGFGRLGPGPVLTVVRNTQTGKIYVGLNTGVPKTVADSLYKAILDQHGRIWAGEVEVVRTDPMAVGGHSEVNALNPAILDRERVLGRKLVEQDYGIFELHNLWLSGDRAMTTAARCEHCARITRGVAVTQSMFVAEGGVVGDVDVPQRGLATRTGSNTSRNVTTVAGETTVEQRGSVTRAGSTTSRPVTTVSGTTGASTDGGGGEGFIGLIGGLLAGLWLVSVPLIKQWFAKNYVHDKWTADQQARVVQTIADSAPAFNIEILSRAATRAAGPCLFHASFLPSDRPTVGAAPIDGKAAPARRAKKRGGRSRPLRHSTPTNGQQQPTCLPLKL
jgi:hypothetical protein